MIYLSDCGAFASMSDMEQCEAEVCGEHVRAKQLHDKELHASNWDTQEELRIAEGAAYW